MKKFRIEKMSCNHCVNAITGALKALENSASVNISKQDKTVEFSGSKSSTEILDVLNAVGYSATVINN